MIRTYNLTSMKCVNAALFVGSRFYSNGSEFRRIRKMQFKEAICVQSAVSLGLIVIDEENPMSPFSLVTKSYKVQGDIIFVNKLLMNKIDLKCFRAIFMEIILRDGSRGNTKFVQNVIKYVDLLANCRRMAQVIRTLNKIFPGFLDRRAVPLMELISAQAKNHVLRNIWFKKPFNRRNIQFWNGVLRYYGGNERLWLKLLKYGHPQLLS